MASFYTLLSKEIGKEWKIAYDYGRSGPFIDLRKSIGNEEYIAIQIQGDQYRHAIVDDKKVNSDYKDQFWKESVKRFPKFFKENLVEFKKAIENKGLYPFKGRSGLTKTFGNFSNVFFYQYINIPIDITVGELAEFIKTDTNKITE